MVSSFRAGTLLFPHSFCVSEAWIQHLTQGYLTNFYCINSCFVMTNTRRSVIPSLQGLPEYWVLRTGNWRGCVCCIVSITDPGKSKSQGKGMFAKPVGRDRQYQFASSIPLAQLQRPLQFQPLLFYQVRSCERAKHWVLFWEE